MLTYTLNGLVFFYNGVRTISVYTERHLANCIANDTQPWAMTFLTVAPKSDVVTVVNAIREWMYKADDISAKTEEEEDWNRKMVDHKRAAFTDSEKKEIVELNDFPYAYVKRS